MSYAVLSSPPVSARQGRFSSSPAAAGYGLTRGSGVLEPVHLYLSDEVFKKLR
jgi:hypothetical protein